MPNKNLPKKYEDEIYEQIVGEYIEGTNASKLAKTYDLSAPNIGSTLDRYNITKRNIEEISIKYDINRQIFEKIDTQEKAYWLGILAADGSNDGKEFRLSLEEKDQDHIVKFSVFLCTNRPIKESIKKDEYGTRKQSILSVGSIKIARDLMHNGIIPRKTHLLKFPQRSIVPTELQPHYIRGYFDGDGNIYSNKRTYQWQLVGNEPFLIKLQLIMMEELNLNKTKMQIPHPKRKNNIRRLRWGGRLQMIKIYNYIYKNSKIHMERKKSYFENNIQGIIN
jgi:intein-encoded DNA endonuclease-like protein